MVTQLSSVTLLGASDAFDERGRTEGGGPTFILCVIGLHLFHADDAHVWWDHGI